MGGNAQPWMGQPPQQQPDQPQAPTPPQPQGPPPQLQGPDQIEQGLQTSAKFYQDQLAANTPKPASGGPIRSLLQNFFSGMGQGMMHEAGLPTQYQKQQTALTGLQQTASAQGLLELHKQMASQYAPVPLVGLDGKPITDPQTGEVIRLPALHAQTFYSGQQQAGARIQAEQIAAGSRLGVAQIQQGGGLQLPVDKTTATLAGVPELADKMLGMGGWKMLNSALQARGYHVQDMGTDGTGPQQGTWVVDRGGNPVSQVSDKSLTKARGIGYAQGRAMYTPFETVEPGTNVPTTISAAQALQTGAPRVSATQAGSFGTKYAQFNDAYGILDNIDRLAGQVDLNDPTVRARVTAGYAALKEPAAKGLAGEVLSNFLARQPIYGSLQPNERELVLSMAQGKAAATGLRGILGQAGTNEMQQRLDAGLMPGGQNVASTESVKQQTNAMRGLLDRFAVGQPGFGLNAPNTPSALPTRGKSGAGAPKHFLGGSANGLPEGTTGNGGKYIVKGGVWVAK